MKEINTTKSVNLAGDRIQQRAAGGGAGWALPLGALDGLCEAPDPAALGELLEELGARSVAVHADVAAAARDAREAKPNRVLAFGSFYTVGPAMNALGLY